MQGRQSPPGYLRVRCGGSVDGLRTACLFLDGFAALSIPVVTMLPAVRVAVPHQEIR